MYEAQHILFRPFRLDVENEKLWHGSQPVLLRPKTFAVLRCLIERAGRLVSKEELLNTVWRGTTVSDVVPIVCVRELRKALGDDAEAPRFIETLARRGYRFIAPVAAAPLVVSSQYSVDSRQEESQKSKIGEFFQAPSPRPSAPALVGRESELTHLHSLLAKAMQGERQFVFISGEAGIGKTALVDTFLSGVRRPVSGVKNGSTFNVQGSTSPHTGYRPLTPDPWLGRGQCIEQHGAGEAYLPLLDVIGRLCREPRGQEVIEILRQHAPTWLMQFPSLLSAADVEALQRKTLGATRERMLREMAEAMEVATTIRLFILVLEDLHWCDASTLDFLAFLACRRGPARLLVIGTYRPAELAVGEHPLATLSQDLSLHRQCEEIPVPLLTPAEVAAYLDLRLPVELRDLMPRDTLACRLHQRTDGNPLFLTNVVDYLATCRHGNKGGNPPPTTEHMLDIVPQSLQQMIEKQIVRLSPEDQRMLEIASVVGVEFSAAAVAAGLEGDVVAVEERCRELARHEQFLRVCGVEEWSDETVATRYGFIHSLYQQVLYQRVTEAQKARLHLRIGTRLEVGCRGHTKENATTLALHFILGRDYQRAVQYSQQAAENAVWRCAFQEANVHFTKGIELLHHWPDTPERTQKDILLHLTVLGPLIAIKGEASPEVELVYARIVQLHRRLGDSELPFMVLLGLWLVRLVRGELTTAQEIAEQIVIQAKREGDTVVQLWSHLVMGICAFYRGDFTAARARCVEATALYEAQQHPQYLLDPKMLGLSFEALNLWMLGQSQLAVTRSQEAVSWGQGLAHPYNSVAALILAAWLHVNLRDGEGAEERIDVLLPLAQTHGFVQYIASGMLLRGVALTEQHQNEEGARLMFQGFEALCAAKVRIGMSAWQGLLAVALGNLGRSDEALAVIADAQTAMDDSGERFFAAELYRIKGELLLKQSRGQGSGAGGQNRGIVVSSQYSVVGREEENQKSKGKKQKLEEARGWGLGASSSPQAPSLKPLAPNGTEHEVEECFLKAIDIARQQQARSFQLRAVMGLVRLRQQQVTYHALRATHHDPHALLVEAHNMLSELCGWFTDECETADLKEARELLGGLEGSSQ